MNVIYNENVQNSVMAAIVSDLKNGNALPWKWWQ